MHDFFSFFFFYDDDDTGVRTFQRATFAARRIYRSFDALFD